MVEINTAPKYTTPTEPAPQHSQSRKSLMFTQAEIVEDQFRSLGNLLPESLKKTLKLERTDIPLSVSESSSSAQKATTIGNQVLETEKKSN